MTELTAKKLMERSLLEAVYQMASEALDPQNFENLEQVIIQLHRNRELGEFKRFPRN